MKYLILDNYDSFTFNLYQQFLTVSKLNHEELAVVRNDQIEISDILKIDLHGIIISPGPGGPQDTGICAQVVEALQARLPILGICLGHQLAAWIHNANVVQAAQAMHGKTSSVVHKSEGLFFGLASPMKVARYHSLIVDKSQVEKNFEIDALAEDGTIMAIRHKAHPLFGIQFHPESFLSEQGDLLLNNFYQLCEKRRSIQDAA